MYVNKWQNRSNNLIGSKKKSNSTKIILAILQKSDAIQLLKKGKAADSGQVKQSSLINIICSIFFFFLLTDKKSSL